MSEREARQIRHEKAHSRSQGNLQQARSAAGKKGYNSTATRNSLQSTFSERFGHDPYDWQLDVTEAILLGLDTVIIAGTGAGKTIPFMLPLLLHKDKLMIVISPLKVLQQDQVSVMELRV
jgi:bloom syndrome protein